MAKKKPTKKHLTILGKPRAASLWHHWVLIGLFIAFVVVVALPLDRPAKVQLSGSFGTLIAERPSQTAIRASNGSRVFLDNVHAYGMQLAEVDGGSEITAKNSSARY